MLVEKILIADRGEIACRIIRTVKKMGYTSVAVFSDTDQNSLHVTMADESIHIGAAAPKHPYMMIENIIRAAKQIQADAIHPGNGFLSKSADFAERCKKEQLILIGPSAESIRLISSKDVSTQGIINTHPTFTQGLENKDQMGFNATHRILEKAILNGHHIAIQILADGFGHCIHLGDIDCSLQHHNKKVITESPSPINRTNLRNTMGATAVAIAESCHYVGMGSVEFLVDENLEFYFLKMNTHIPTEHPVTELITQIDLVEQQIRIATGEPLQLKQSDIGLKGHAIAVCLYAEDSNDQDMPQAGRISRWIAPAAEGIRCDAGIHEGHIISTNYKSIIAQVIGFGQTRAQALRHLSNALKNTTICGIKTNRDILIRLLDADYVREGQFDTSTLSSHEAFRELLETEHTIEIVVIAAIIKAASKILPTFFSHPSLIPHQNQRLTLHNALYNTSLKFNKSHLNCLQCEVKVTNHVEEGIATCIATHSVLIWSVANKHAEITFEHVRTHYHYHIEDGQIWLSNRQFSGIVESEDPLILSDNKIDQQLYTSVDDKI